MNLDPNAFTNDQLLWGLVAIFAGWLAMLLGWWLVDARRTRQRAKKVQR